MLPVLFLTACAPSPNLSVTLDIVDEAGVPVDNAQFIVARDTLFADGGRIRVQNVQGPVSGVLSAPGHLDEPVVIGRSDAGSTRTVRLWGDDKWALHAGGDVMFGRRFTEEGGLLATDAEVGAQSVVRDIAPLFAAADVSVVNVETVLGEFPVASSYPGKRYVLESPSRSVAGLQSMGVDVAVLANNHARDWLDEGIRSTRQVLRDADIQPIGASPNEDDVDEPVIIEHNGVTLGFLAYTTLNGSFVNDDYPGADEPIPADLELDRTWQYEERTWTFEGDTWSVPEQPRRIGPAWDLFREVEFDLSTDERADAFASLRSVYPEVQDWVARRGHGGAARWHSDSVEQIAQLKQQVDVVIVNLHGGYDLAPAPSSAVRAASAAAAEAGADLVVGHHPHVMHGAAWADDTLIVHSLGNLVFDQESLPTRASGMLRTVWDGDELLESTLLPIELVDYRPIPVTDVAAARIHRQVAETTLAELTSRVGDDGIEAFYEEPIARPAAVRLQDHQLHIERDATDPESETVRVRSNRIVDLPTHIGTGLVDPRLNTGASNLWVGRDLLGWGHFEDVLADGEDAGGVHWLIDSEWETIDAVRRTNDGRAVLHLDRDVFNEGTVTTRFDGQIQLVPHRLWGTDTALDPAASYALRFRARQTGGGVASLRLQAYTYDRGTLAVDPTTIELYDEDIPLAVGSSWREIVIDIDANWLDEGVNRLRPSFRLAPPERGSSALYIDAVQVLELRQADQMPEGWGAWDVVRNTGESAADVLVSVR